MAEGEHTGGDTGLRESMLVAQGRRDLVDQRPEVVSLGGWVGLYSAKHFSYAISSEFTASL